MEILSESLPFTKHREVEEPGRALRRRAADPPRPVLPKSHGPRTWKGTARERDPLASSLTGSGRAGKPGRLLGSSSSVYEGDVLAGRPHGWGRYYAPGPDPKQGLLLQYEGEFYKGERQGQGTCQYHAAKEAYVGQWAAGRRDGQGRQQYANGDSYDGAWRADRRHGQGRLSVAASGDVFIGNFVGDKRQGLGVLYLVCKGKKYVAEWVDDKPVCGTVLALDSADLEPPSAHGLAETLAREAARRQLSMGGTGPTGADSTGSPAPLPVIYLSQPSKVLAREFVAVRAAREARAARPPPPAALPGAAPQAAAAGGDATLAAQQVELLRHAFTLMAGDDGRRARLLPRQLPELAVLAGLDPAARPTVALLDQVRARCRSDAAGGVSLDALLHAAMHFRAQPLAPAAESGAGTESQGSDGLLSLHDIQEGDAGGGGGAAEGPACSARSCGDWAAGGPVSDRTGTDGEVCKGVQQGAASQVAAVGSAGIKAGAGPQHETAATEPAEEQWAPAPLDAGGHETDDGAGVDEASTMGQGQEEEEVPPQEPANGAAAEEAALPPAAGAQVGADGSTAAGADVAALGAPVPEDELDSNTPEHSQQQLEVARGGPRGAAGEEQAQEPPTEGAAGGGQGEEGERAGGQAVAATERAAEVDEAAEEGFQAVGSGEEGEEASRMQDAEGEENMRGEITADVLEAEAAVEGAGMVQGAAEPQPLEHVVEDE